MDQLNIIRTREGVQELIEYLKPQDLVSFDCETTGLAYNSDIIGLSICAEPGIAYYVITAQWDVAEQKLRFLETKESMRELCQELRKKRLIGHNAVFDCQMIANNYEVELIDAVFCDTMVLAHLIDENRRIGLKDLGYNAYGSSAKAEQEAMKASVQANGGHLTKGNYELYKGDSELIAKYGAKDTILTYNLFFEFMPQLMEEGLDKFFFDDESMPLLRGPTYQLNTTGLKVDISKLNQLKLDLEKEIAEAENFITHEITNYVKDKYPATNKKTVFNISSNNQLAWLLYEKLGNIVPAFSKGGREMIRSIGLKVPYTNPDRKRVVDQLRLLVGTNWTDNTGKVKKIKEYWTYASADKSSLSKYEDKYKWVKKLLEYKQATKTLTTYVRGIEEKMQYGIIRPNFLQARTKTGRYASKDPNFQNLPRDDKRVKSCIVARPGKVFVGADYEQIEPRIFASLAQDSRLMACFSDGTDFYSVIGMEVFSKYDCSPYKKDANFFGTKYPKLRATSKAMALAIPYGTTAPKLAPTLGVDRNIAQEIIDDYLTVYASVYQMMLKSYEDVQKLGYVETMFGRKRRLPEAKDIKRIYGELAHDKYPYEVRTLLNIGMNFKIQGAAATIINRALILFLSLCKDTGLDVKIVLQVHDEGVVECNEEDGEVVRDLLKHAMETVVELPGVPLRAEPKIATNLGDLK